MLRYRMRPFAVLLSLLGFLALPAEAEETYQIDPVHSTVSFTIRHLISRVQGRFGKFQGTILTDQANPASAKVKAEIDAGSIDTGITDRDNHLRSADFFDAAKYPKISFESSEATVQSPEKVTLKGNLSMHGVTKPVILEVTGLGFGPGMRGEARAGFEGKTTLSRKDFGISWNKPMDAGNLLLGDEVEVTIYLEAVKSAPPASPPAAKAAGN